MPDVLVYRRPGCMFCEQVQELLAENGIPYRPEEIVDRDEQERISRRYGALAFPLVLVDGVYLGGFTHVVQLHSEGRLRSAILGTPRSEDPPRPGPALGSLEAYASLGRLLAQRKQQREPDE